MFEIILMFVSLIFMAIALFYFIKWKKEVDNWSIFNYPTENEYLKCLFLGAGSLLIFILSLFMFGISIYMMFL